MGCFRPLNLPTSGRNTLGQNKKDPCLFSKSSHRMTLFLFGLIFGFPPFSPLDAPAFYSCKSPPSEHNEHSTTLRSEDWEHQAGVLCKLSHVGSQRALF